MKILKNNHISKWGLALGLGTLLVSTSACDDQKYLNPTPATAISGTNAFDTPDRVLGLVNGIYKRLKVSTFMVETTISIPKLVARNLSIARVTPLLLMKRGIRLSTLALTLWRVFGQQGIRLSTMPISSFKV